MARPEKVQDMLPSLWRILRRFWPYLGEQRTLIAGSLIALFIEIGFRVLEPWPLKYIFDHVLITKSSGNRSGIAILDALEPMTLLTVAAIALIVIIALRALASYFNTVGFALIGNRVVTNVRSELYRHLQNLSLSFHAKAKSGDLTIRVISDIGLLKEVTVTAVLPLLANVLLLFGMVGIMFRLHWQLTILALSIFPLFWISIIRLGHRIRHVSRQQRRREGAMAATAAESIGQIKIVQALSLEDTFHQTFSSHNKKSMKDGVQAKKLAVNLERTVDVLIGVSRALVLLYGARLVVSNTLTPGDLLVFLAYLKGSFRPVRNFAKHMSRLAKASAAGDRVLDILETEPDIRDCPDAVPAPVFRGEVRFDNVSFGYDNNNSILDGVKFKVRPGEHIALVGLSGIGKSTLVNLIMRLYDPGEGSVMIDGNDIRNYTIASLRSQISMVLQDSMLFGTSVYDNIAYGAPDATREEIETAARLANAHEFIEALPQSYDTELGERGVTLSNGQRQRIAIARAAIRKSAIIILDEPTTGLDKENEGAVMETLKRLSQGRTTFLIVHDLKLAVEADRIFYLENSAISECGTHEELLRSQGKYAALYKLQTALDEHDPARKQRLAVSC